MYDLFDEVKPVSRHHSYERGLLPLSWGL